jgi:CubicO group peptidase (beta-lactamase class C family)
MAVSPSVLGDLLEVFERNFRDRGEIGASVSVWWNGVELVSSGKGWCEKEKSRPWTEKTLIPVYSATKGSASATMLLALESKGLDQETPVREVWPRFPLAGATFAEVMSHQWGLAALDLPASVWKHEEVVAAIEAQQPGWVPGEGHGYHPRTFGFLLEEPLRRLAGMPLGEYWRKEIAAPLDLDFWIGLPESHHPRVARLYPGKVRASDLEDGFYAEFNRDGSMTRRAFLSPRGLHSVQEMNDPMVWSAGFPAMGGMATASALAKFYQAAIGTIPSPLSPRIRHALATPLSAAYDRVLLKPTVFTCGCQMDPLSADGRKIRTLYGKSTSAFGHPGAGGSHGFGDPDLGLSFAYLMNQMEMSVMPGEKCRELVDALYADR